MSVLRGTSYTVPGIHVTDRELAVPLVWGDDADPRRLTLFVRELAVGDVDPGDGVAGLAHDAHVPHPSQRRRAP